MFSVDKPVDNYSKNCGLFFVDMWITLFFRIKYLIDFVGYYYPTILVGYYLSVCAPHHTYPLYIVPSLLLKHYILCL